LNFLSIRPVHTVVMTSFINDNGIVSDLNRGKFYGYRNAAGSLEGVALIGHTTLVESRSDDALAALAITARSAETPIHLIMSSGEAAQTFWDRMTNGLTKPRLSCTELLFEVSFPFLVQDCEWDVRLAKPEELVQVAEAQAEVAEIECGVNPMTKDREGFLKRVMRRIEQGRVFVAFDNDNLVFKADIIAETADVVYLEGIYTGHEYRGQGIGSRCLSTLSLQLMSRAENICMLSNVDFGHAHSSFEKAGYRHTDQCTTLFV
jgi:GNAT superfamily N-acetyltransferase